MNIKKLYWKVHPKDTSRAGWGTKRSWPTGYYDKEQTNIAVHLICDTGYSIGETKSGNHKPITVGIVKHTPRHKWSEFGAWNVFYLPQKMNTLEEAKQFALAYINEHPECFDQAEFFV